MDTFDAVYRVYFQDVYRYLIKLTGDQALAEDLTSETFLKAMNAFGRFRGDCDVRVWLCQIAKRCYYSELRRRKESVSLEDLPEPNADGDPEGGALTTDEAERAYALLHRMAEPYKEVFLLRALGELSFRQIGALFGKSENWACVTYHRARRKLQAQLEEST
ncbi:MAG: sigma-70 family RNA polymerase sigma factor [Clostridiales bacterium]|nr:sigma-70 family RNA polymerase sigma factor [Clostridiales bacterium]